VCGTELAVIASRLLRGLLPRVQPRSPLETTETHVRVAVCGEPDPDVIADLEREFAKPVELVPVGEDELADGIRRAYAAAESMVGSSERPTRERRLLSRSGRELADARDLASQPPWSST